LRSWRKRGWVEGKAKLKMVDHWAEMGGVASHDIKNMPLSVFSSIVAFVPIRTQDTDQAGRKFCCLGDESRLGENKQVRFCAESQADEMAISIPGSWNIVSQNCTRKRSLFFIVACCRDLPSIITVLVGLVILALFQHGGLRASFNCLGPRLKRSPSII
jgi:hypothetical protein